MKFLYFLRSYGNQKRSAARIPSRSTGKLGIVGTALAAFGHGTLTLRLRANVREIGSIATCLHVYMEE